MIAAWCLSRYALSCACLLSLLIWALPVMADDSLTARVAKTVHDSKILGSDTSVRVQIVEKEREVAISTMHNPKSTDRDCKIDAILIARSLMDVYPGKFAKVRITFYDRNNASSYRQVSVREGDIRAFASRQISQDTLLSEIELISAQKNQPSSAAQSHGAPPEVVQGPYRGERMQLLGQLSALQDKGVGVKPYYAQFRQLEGMVDKHEEDAVLVKEIRTLTAELNQLTDDYEKMVEQRTRGGKSSDRGAPAHAAPPQLDRQEQARTAIAPQAQAGQSNRAEAARVELGDLAPAEGPLFLRRYRVARSIADLRDQNKPFKSYLRVQRELEELAAKGSRDALHSRLRWIESQLGLPSISEED